MGSNPFTCAIFSFNLLIKSMIFLFFFLAYRKCRSILIKRIKSINNIIISENLEKKINYYIPVAGVGNEFI
ncbi:MAG: hypothetical protein DRO88_13690 [Promethearchaeia archaeon]|nr:MAG: hypothetical protein DRO88_13690 [Candidatus Lokiarchaeia archaeon]